MDRYCHGNTDGDDISGIEFKEIGPNTIPALFFYDLAQLVLPVGMQHA
jgi:hypothetical protein